MPSEIDLFREYIQTQKDVELGQPTTEQEIAAFEARYGVKLPADVKEYFLKINGVYISGGFIRLEALSELSPIIEYKYANAEYISRKLEDSARYFRFGGYDISVWEWLIRLDSNADTDNPIIVVHENVTKIADSFSDFLQKYRSDDPESLLNS
jgi:hypothetical protein